jgi:WD40 repeat protein
LKSEGSAKFLAFSPDGSLLAASGVDGIALFEMGTGKLYRNLPFPIRSDRKVAVEFAPNSLAVAASTAGEFTAWQVSDGTELVSQRADQSEFDAPQPAFAFSPSGTQLVFSDAAHALHVWDLEAGREFAVCEGHKALVRAVMFTPDGKYVVSASSDNDRTVRLWRIHDPAENRVLIDGQPVTLLTVAPDGKTLITGPEVKQWDISGAGRAVARGTIADRGIYADQMRLLSDGKTLALCRGETAVLWDLEQQQVRQSQEFPPSEGNAPLKQLAVSPDGQTVALAAESVQLWDRRPGRCERASRKTRRSSGLSRLHFRRTAPCSPSALRTDLSTWSPPAAPPAAPRLRLQGPS